MWRRRSLLLKSNINDLYLGTSPSYLQTQRIKVNYMQLSNLDELYYI